MNTTETTMAKTTTYLVYRHGSNAANQSLRATAPVAIVDAPSAEAACETEGDERLTLDSSLWLKLAPHVDCWANQRFSAVPLSRAPRADVREVTEEDAFRPSGPVCVACASTENVATSGHSRGLCAGCVRDFEAQRNS